MTIKLSQSDIILCRDKIVIASSVIASKQAIIYTKKIFKKYSELYVISRLILKNCSYIIKYNYNKMADNIYKNSDHYKREMDKLTSTNKEIDQSTSTKVNPEKDTKESKNLDKKESSCMAIVVIFGIQII